MDVTPYIKAKSDQLNADDLMGGPICVTVMGVKQGNADQRILVEIDGGHLPYHPSKTDLRVMVAAWGPEGNEWVGRKLVLHRDPDVVYAGVKVGGVRIIEMSHIKADMTLALAETRGKKKARFIKKLVETSAPQAKQTAAPKAQPVPMPDHVFFDKLEKAKASVQAGKATVEQVIAKIEASVLLSEAQREELETLIPQQSDAPSSETTDNQDGMFD